MNKFFLALALFVLPGLSSLAQNAQPEWQKIQETAKTYMRNGDYNNAVLVLNRALITWPDNLELLKDLAFSYYLKRDYVKALETAKPFADRKDVDVQAYQILAMVYKALEERKDSEKLYKAALKKFPASGALHSEYGELLWAKKDFADAAREWEKGIETDPNFSGNYYNAAKYYYLSSDKVWGLIYGEIFINIESYSQRTVEIKSLLLEGYKKLFNSADLTKGQNTKNEFVAIFLQLMQQHSGAVATGVNPETLAVLRGRFILDWQDKYAAKYPLRLFEHHNQLLKLGLFEAYNQWIFEAARDLTAFQQWTATHGNSYNEFTRLQKNRLFKIPSGQYYQDRK